MSLRNFPKTGKFIESSKHILFVTPGFAQDEQDTTCIPALQLFARALNAAGFTVSIVAIHFPYSETPYQWHGMDVFPLNGKNKRHRGLQHKRKALEIVSKIQSQKPIDHVHSFWLDDATKLGKSIAKHLNVPLVATVMGQEMRTAAPRYKKWAKSDFPIVALCAFQAEQLKRKTIEPTHIIPWGVDASELKEKTLDLVCVGNLVPLKNIRYFVALCGLLLEDHPQLTAKIIGTGPLSSALQNQIETLGLNHHVELTGQLSYAETQAAIASAKVLVHPSNFEGFGMTIVEAMALRTHVVASPVGIAKELNQVEHLSFDEARDTAVLASALKRPMPEAFIFEIAETVEKYRSIYGF